MEFDLSKVYTAANADELKKGDNVFFSNTMGDLKYVVEESDNYYRGNIKDINNEDAEYRFQIEGKTAYSLAYLVKRAKKFRPFKTITELTEAWIRKTSIPTVANTMPTIWLKFKKSPNDTVSIAAFCFKHDQIYIIDKWINLETLFDELTFIDGSPCGVEDIINSSCTG